MREKIAGMEIREFAALLVRLSMQNISPKKVAGHLRKSDSLVHKWAEGDEPQVPNLEQFLEVLTFTRDFEGVKRLAEACGFVVVRRNGSVPQVLRDLAEDLERQEAGGGKPRPATQYTFPVEREA
jgi:hypothetical protein